MGEGKVDTGPLRNLPNQHYTVTLQTGSGKTHTMEGGAGESRGIYSRALHDLFSTIRARSKEATYSVRVSMVEIYKWVARGDLGLRTTGIPCVAFPRLRLRPVKTSSTCCRRRRRRLPTRQFSTQRRASTRSKSGRCASVKRGVQPSSQPLPAPRLTGPVR